MYLRMIPQYKIAEELNLSPATVSRDIRELHEEWKTSRLYDMNEAKRKELARIDVLERQYWEGWELSKQKAHSEADAIAGPGSTVTLHQKREQFGDPRYLNGIMSCINKRCEILGLNAPKSLELNPGKTWAQFIGVQNNIMNLPPGHGAPGEEINVTPILIDATADLTPTE